MMSLRLLLLVLAALAACLRSGRSQGDSLPPSLVDLVLNTPISSVDDLKRILDVESIEEDDEKPENEIHANETHQRFSRSLSIQVAQQAMCKVRTEVMEVTRAMLDKRNANFLLWPPCVEVQRCSGCCNTRVLQCVPVAIDTRHLQMTKIQFVNRQPVYEKVIIPIEDHVSCSCQPRLSSNAPRLQTTPLTPPRPHPKVMAKKSQSKQELHQHDELKHNQRLHLEEKETHELQWQSKYTLSHTQGYRQSPSQQTLTHTPVYVSKEDVPTRQTTLGAPHMMSDETQTEEVVEHHVKPEHHTHVGSGDGTTVKTPTVGQHYTQRHHEEQQSKPQQPHHQTTPQQPEHNPAHDSVQSEHSVPHSGQVDGLSRTYSHVEVIGQSSGLSEVLGDHQSEVRKHHHQSEASNHQKLPQEQEMEQNQEEMQHHLRHQHHHHHQHHTTQVSNHRQTNTQQTVTKAPQTTPSAPQSPPPLQPPRKWRRKHRRRMSKASMRAMIMVMS